jgi:hypothetical protein
MSKFDNKRYIKSILDSHGMLTPKTYGFLNEIGDFAQFWKSQEKLREFVFKPNCLSCGLHVHVIKKKGNQFIEADGSTRDGNYYYDEAYDILKNHHHQGVGVIIEELVHTHRKIRELYGSVKGIADIRLFIFKDRVTLGWMRTPCKASGYLSNWSKGGVCYFIGMDGVIMDGTDLMVNYRRVHPDSGKDPTGYQVPFWNEMVKTAEEAALIFRERFHTLDMTVNEKGKAVIIEGELTPDMKMMKGRAMSMIWG